MGSEGTRSGRGYMRMLNKTKERGGANFGEKRKLSRQTFKMINKCVVDLDFGIVVS
jgi:hypothetical protein